VSDFIDTCSYAKRKHASKHVNTPISLRAIVYNYKLKILICAFTVALLIGRSKHYGKWEQAGNKFMPQTTIHAKQDTSSVQNILTHNHTTAW
jgi:hypothetical protein